MSEGETDSAPAFPDVTVVITAHDAGEALYATIEGLRAQGRFAAVQVIDSGSTDGSIEALAARCPHVEVISLGENLGPCVTRNRGMEAASTPLVLLLDDDMRLEEGLVARLHEELLRDDRRVIAGPRLLMEDAPGTILYEGVVHHFTGLAHMRRYRQADRPAAVAEVDGLTSAVLLVRREAALAAGGFEPSFFFLMEDVEFTLRLAMAGHVQVVVPDAKAWNAGSSAGLSLGREGYPERRVYLHAKNRMLLVFGLYRWRTIFLLCWPLLLMDLAWFGFALLGGRGRSYVKGKRAALGQWKDIKLARKRMRGLRRRSDASLLRCPPLTLTDQAARGKGKRALLKILDGSLRLMWRPVSELLP